MAVPARNASFNSTIKCSSCAAEVDLLALADHVCLPNDVQNTTPHDACEPLPLHPPRRGASLYKRDRPQLAKIDPAAPRLKPLNAAEAASIAHDLGLPSPLSATSASGRRSPRRPPSRKNTIPYVPPGPPSPDLPMAQDCAFPPFPKLNKPKRAQTQDNISQKPRSSSRTKTYEPTSANSDASSVYSYATNGAVRRRLSAGSTRQRSRQSTIEESTSVPSTAPTSPRRSEDGDYPTQKEGSVNEASFPPLHPTVSSNSTQGLTSSASPGTPGWSFSPETPNSAALDSLPLDITHNGLTPEPAGLGGSQAFPTEAELYAARADERVTFESILTADPVRTSFDMFSEHAGGRPQPKRPVQLTRLNTSPDDFRTTAAPLSARSPTAPASGGLGLTRTLTQLFSRKRSQSTSSKRNIRLELDDAPAVPARPEAAFGMPHTNASDQMVPTQDLGHASQPDINPAVNVSPRIPEDEGRREAEQSQLSPSIEAATVERVHFDFKFEGEGTSQPTSEPSSGLTEQDAEESNANLSSTTAVQPAGHESNANRASIDSTSSYGSIGFSHTSMSSRSTDLSSDGLRSKIIAALDPNHQDITTTEVVVPLRPQNALLSPDSPTDPLLHHGRLSPVPEIPDIQQTEATTPASTEEQPVTSAPSEHVSSSYSSTDSSAAETPTSPPSPQTALLPARKESISQDGKTTAPAIPKRSDSIVKRPTTPAGSKGMCRGCTKVILQTQKSISSKDGRLTGKYHKECFVCRTCAQPFATADFYVYNDQPFCAHHYHVLNNTLCASCGKGIEGQFLETFDISGRGSKKFHARCLSCFHCRVQLSDDYFEFNGRIFCERDAFRAYQAPKSPHDNAPSRPSPLVREYVNSGEPRTKGRFPERRTTRLMMA